MAKGILGKKIGMSQVFLETGQFVPVTLIEAGPCVVLQVKTGGKEGYSAVQLGYDVMKESLANKAELGHAKKAGTAPRRFVTEIVMAGDAGYEPGQEITVDLFSEGEHVDIIGTSIGKRFQGGMKRWNWTAGPGGHGSMHHRRIGSIGASSFPSRVVKGHHMPGHMGAARVTVQNLKVVKVDKENNLIAVKGAVPGHDGGYLIIREAKKKPAHAAKDGAKGDTPKAGAKGDAPKAGAKPAAKKK